MAQIQGLINNQILKIFNALLEKNKGDYKSAAHEYFKNHLQDNYLMREIDGVIRKIYFIGSTWTKFKVDMAKDETKAKLLPFIPSIIVDGNYDKEEAYHSGHDNVKMFYSFMRRVNYAKNESYEVIVDVAERTDLNSKLVAYNYTREGTLPYDKRKEKTTASSSTSGLNRSPLDAMLESNIQHIFEIVNIKIKRIGKKVFESGCNEPEFGTVEYGFGMFNGGVWTRE